MLKNTENLKEKVSHTGFRRFPEYEHSLRPAFLKGLVSIGTTLNSYLTLINTLFN